MQPEPRTMDQTRMPGIRALFVMAALTLAASCGMGDLKSPLYDGKSPMAFDRARWAACAHYPHVERYLMLDDLLARHPLVGMTRDEVTTLLGPFHDEPDYPGWRDCYYLGPERGLGVDFEWLILKFEADVVASYQVRRD